MTAAIQKILDAFERLSPTEKREAATAILCSLGELDQPPLDDESLAQIADESFQLYDAREAGQDVA